VDTDDDEGDPRPVGDDPDPESARARWSITASPNGTRVLTAGAALDARAAAELRREAMALLARSAHPLVVDLTAVRSTEAAAAVVFRELASEAGDADVDLRVVRDPGATGVARAVLGDESLFDVYPTLDAALRRRTDGAAPPG
jgi:anti-anti-sigma regulatory factor